MKSKDSERGVKARTRRQISSAARQRIMVTMHESVHAEIHHFVESANEAQSLIEFEHILLTEKEKKCLFRSPLDAKHAFLAITPMKTTRHLSRADILIAIVPGNLQDQNDDEYFYVSSQDYSPNGSRGALLSLFFLNERSTFMREGRREWRSLKENVRAGISSDVILLILLCAVAGELTAINCHDESCGCVMDYCQTPTDIIGALDGGFRFCSDCVPALRVNPEGQAVIRIAEWLSEHPFRCKRLGIGEFDVFICHNSVDKSEIRRICEVLRKRGVRPWLDEEQLRPGFPWQQSLEDQIDKIQAAAVFVGSDGIGPWQSQEIRAFLQQFVSRDCPVIPCILPKYAKTIPKLPVFLSGMEWVDFNNTRTNPIGRLMWGITGRRPNSCE